MASSRKSAEADALLKYLASPQVVPVLREAGLEP
jgi:molybdate transport system substrate-binding protein